MTDLRDIARLLNGDVVRGQLLAPGPGHSPQDRSLSVKLSATAPDGFLVFSHSGDRWQDCRDHVAERLGLRRECGAAQVTRLKPPRPAYRDGQRRTRHRRAEYLEPLNRPDRNAGSSYLASRGLRSRRGSRRRGAPLESAHPRDGRALSQHRDRRTASGFGHISQRASAEDRAQVLWPGRWLRRDARSVRQRDDRAFHFRRDRVRLGGQTDRASSSMGAWLGRRPRRLSRSRWDRTLSILREHDAANEKAANACAERWLAAGREVRDVTPIHGKDINDAIKGAR